MNRKKAGKTKQNPLKEFGGPSAKLISDTQDTNKNGNGKSNARKKRKREEEEKSDKTRNQLQLWTVISAGHLFTKGQL